LLQSKLKLKLIDVLIELYARHNRLLILRVYAFDTRHFTQVLDELMCPVHKSDGLSLSEVYHLLTAYSLKRCEN